MTPTDEVLADLRECQERIRFDKMLRSLESEAFFEALTGPAKIEADLQARGEAMAARYSYDLDAIGFEIERYRFGSLANNWEAKDMRAVLDRAQKIARGRS